MSKSSNAKTFINGLTTENPTFVQLLGMCPTLAVTTSLVNALGMGLSATFVLVFSNLAISLIRKFVPNKIIYGILRRNINVVGRELNSNVLVL